MDVGPLSKLSGRARLYLAGGCRSSGWALVLPAVAGVSRWPVVFLLFRFPFRGRRPEDRSVDRSEGVSIKEGVPASQSALLLGPENSLRFGSHSMSSCDGVRPIVVRAGAVHPEGVTHTPHECSSQPPGTGHQPENWQRVSMFCCFGSLHQKLRVDGPPTGSVHRDGSFFLCIVSRTSVCCGRCTRSLVLYSQTGAALRRHFFRAVGAAVFFSSLSLRRLRLRVAAQASRTSLSRCFCKSRR